MTASHGCIKGVGVQIAVSCEMSESYHPTTLYLFSTLTLRFVTPVQDYPVAVHIVSIIYTW